MNSVLFQVLIITHFSLAPLPEVDEFIKKMKLDKENYTTEDECRSARNQRAYELDNFLKSINNKLGETGNYVRVFVVCVSVPSSKI